MQVTFPNLFGKGAPAEARLGDDRELAIGQMHGKYYLAAKQGRVFSQTATPLGLAVPIYTATAIGASGICALPIWNPPDSGINVVPISVDLGYGSGTAVYGSVGLMIRKLRAIATGEACSALAPTVPINGLALSAGAASRVTSANGAGTVTVTAGVAADWQRTLFSINLEAQTGTAHGSLSPHYDFDGTLIIPPGNLAYLAATAATVALYASGIVWEEVPI